MDEGGPEQRFRGPVRIDAVEGERLESAGSLPPLSLGFELICMGESGFRIAFCRIRPGSGRRDFLYG